MDINKFSLAQMTSNNDGKTSASGTMGSLTIIAGLLGFMVGVVDFFLDKSGDIMLQSVIVITIGCGLLGYRKSQDVPAAKDEDSVEG